MRQSKWITSAVVCVAWVIQLPQSAGGVPPSLTAPPELPVRPASRIAPPALDSVPPTAPHATSAPAESGRGATSQAETQIKLLKARIEKLEFCFCYRGPSDKPFYTVTLSVPDFMIQDEPKPFERKERITAAQAGKIIDVLAASGFNGWPGMSGPSSVQPDPLESYWVTLKIACSSDGPMGFDLKMLRTFDAIRAALDDGPGKSVSDAAKAMDLLIKRMSGLRKQWEAAGPTAKP